MRPPEKKRERLWLAAGLLLAVAKLWLTRGQSVFAIGPSDHDDFLFLRLAEYLVRGDWLGPYDQLTLIKGPFYPLWIAGAFLLGIPLFLSQHLLYAGACALFTRACRPAIKSGGARFALYALLLWNPMSFDASSMGRVLRQHVYASLGVMIFAGCTALYQRRAETFRRQLPWALLLGLAGGAFWLTREESVWIGPGVFLLFGAYLSGAWRSSPGAVRRAGKLLAVAAAFAAAPVLLVCTLNWRHYGWFGTVEFRAAAFRDAYGAMLRVRIGPDLPFVPVTREAREAMYQVSPAFATLRPPMEGWIARDWARSSEGLTGIPPEQKQVAGGWMMWALRDSAKAAGHYDSARHALSFYRQMAQEINRACEQGKLPARPARSGFMPPWRDGQTGKIAETALEFAEFVIRFRTFSAEAPQSFGSEEELRLFRDLTREKISPPNGQLASVGAAEYVLNEHKVECLQAVGKALRWVLYGLALLAHALWLTRAAHALSLRQWTYPLTLAAAAWGACFASVLMHAMIQVTSFPVQAISSFAPIYPLLLIFVAATLWDALVAWGSPFPSGAKVAFAPPESGRLDRPAPAVLTWVAGLVALTPFFLWHAQFAKLFWFADDLFLLDQISRMGFRPWTTEMFAENFAPLFKLLWGGAAFVFHGSYLAMLVLLWLTHALNIALFGRLLSRAGFGWFPVLAAQLVFGLSVANLETLGWSVQWSAVLATAFLLGALLWLEMNAAAPRIWTMKLHGILLLLITASACSFSRGVLTGGVVALALLLPLLAESKPVVSWPRVWPALLCAAPAALVMLAIGFFAHGNHEQMAGHGGEMLAYGLYFFLLNPFQALLDINPWGPAAVLWLGALKCALIFFVLRRTSGRKRALLLVLLAYDLGNAVLLGIGRYHTGLETAVSSRYCYSSLLATLPFAAAAIEFLLQRRPLPAVVHHMTIAVILLGLIAHSLRGWPAPLNEFCNWRGSGLRQLFSDESAARTGAKVPALEFMPVSRAKELIRAYNLH
jgi:hypothetical protein